MANRGTTDESEGYLIERIFHEIHSPISRMRGNASFLRRRIWELDKTRVDESLDDILSDSEALLRLVGGLELHFGLNSRSIRLERVRLWDVLIETIQSLNPLLAKTGFSSSQIGYDTTKMKRATVTAERRKLKVVVFNLLHNSIVYAHGVPEELRIQIDLEEIGDRYEIKFKDWGIGIKSEYEQRVFEAGFRAPETMGNVEGLGLGLVTSKRIMVEMGGDLKLLHNLNPTEFDVILWKNPKIE